MSSDENNTKLLQKYQDILNQLMLSAKQNSKITIKEFLQNLELN